MDAPRFEVWRWQQMAWGVAVLAVFVAGRFLAGMPELWRPFLLPCIFHRLTGWPCPTCGGVRAPLAFARGEWLAALQLNPLLVAAYSAIAASGILLILFAACKKRLHRARAEALISQARWWLLGAVGLNWIYLLVQGAMP